MYASGPYILSHKNDFETTFCKNAGYMKGTEHEPEIEEVLSRMPTAPCPPCAVARFISNTAS